MKSQNKILAIYKRTDPTPHYALHFDNHVECWTLDGKLLKRSNVEVFHLSFSNFSSRSIYFNNSHWEDAHYNDS